MVVFGFEGKNEVFDDTKSTRSSGVFDTKKHSNVKFKADYRRIGKYYKSPKRYQDERKRRKKVLEYYEKGLSYKVIAERLGVSERTAKCDMAKIKPYYERKIKNFMRSLQQERIADFEAMLEGKSLLQRFNILTNEIVKRTNLRKQREYRRSKIFLTIDLDNVVDGWPLLVFNPKPPFKCKKPFEVFVIFAKGGEHRIGAGLTISS